MKINLRAIYIIMCLCMTSVSAMAQKFYNLTSQEVKVDSVLPLFAHTESLPAAYRDSTYTFEIVYPEFVDMPSADIVAYSRLATALPPALPQVRSYVSFDRKLPMLHAEFCPVVMRNGKYQVLASFMLRRVAQAKAASITTRLARVNSPMQSSQLTENVAPADRYAKKSVLRSGKWAKIRVPSSGIYQLTDAVVRKAGFSNLAKVKVYGYGGNLQNEVLHADDLISCDDLRELPTYNTADGRRLFYGRGPVSWSASTNNHVRIRNPYSDYGYYFLTESDADPTYYADSIQFVATIPQADLCHDLYEVDDYAYAQLGRNLCGSKLLYAGDSLVVEFDSSLRFSSSSSALTVSIVSDAPALMSVTHNGYTFPTYASIFSSASGSIKAQSQTVTFSQLQTRSASGRERIVLRVKSGYTRLDYVSLSWGFPQSVPSLSASAFPAPEYVYNITNQNHHADPQADMVIIIPTSQKLLAQAQRIKKMHEERDGMSVNIVPADELYNEFSSGTPDASAYRHYLKMLYDRASSQVEQPKYLLLLGGSVWDNRFKTSLCRQYNADDYLLAFESEESFDLINSYVDDGFYGMLDDGEGANPLYRDKVDVAVGRMPVVNASEAKAMVDKLLSYVDNANRDAWLNTLFFMGDDGDQNTHMTDANTVADQVISSYPGYLVKKLMWDAYNMESTATGNSYPDVSTAIKKQQSQGALLMNYVGHGSEWQFSHENVLRIADFQNFTNTNLPLWITIGCDFMPFDRLADNIGMKAVLNPNGGAVALIGSTRTVYSNYNAYLNKALMRYLLSTDDDGKPMAVGEALRRAKNAANTERYANNSLQFSLLGDPAMRLNLPTAQIVIDSICGVNVSQTASMPKMKAGALVKVAGHIEGADAFNGNLSLCVRDSRETIVCRLNQPLDASEAFTYTDRTKTIYNGRNRIVDGQFSVEFAVPKDINYSDDTGLITAWAVSDDHSIIAQGYSESFTVGESQLAANDSIGPSVYCYLNSPSFQNGGTVNSTPYFVAEITDRDGINASGAGIGHDMQLCIDGRADMTYSLNDNFLFDFGSYTSGSTYYSLPQLDEGWHSLRFRAWDIQNNATVSELRFCVAKSLKPTFSISCTDNPARESTTFIISHDRQGSNLDVTVEVFDLSGRRLWSHNESGVGNGSAYTVTWNLTTDGGASLDSGIYLYRVKLGADNAVKTSKAKKLIITGNK